MFQVPMFVLVVDARTDSRVSVNLSHIVKAVEYEHRIVLRMSSDKNDIEVMKSDIKSMESLGRYIQFDFEDELIR